MTPERSETPNSTVGKTVSPKRAPAPPQSGARERAPQSEKENTPTPDSGDKTSPLKEETPESRESSKSPREASMSPREANKETGSTIPMMHLELEGNAPSHEEIGEQAMITPPPEFQEDIDKLSDEGIGRSADEISDTSSQVRI